jgi:hypothetical protein
MHSFEFKKLCTAIVVWLATGCTATLTAPELGPNHPANPAAAEPPMPTLPPTLKSYRPAGSPAPSDGPGSKEAMEGADHSQHVTPRN